MEIPSGDFGDLVTEEPPGENGGVTSCLLRPARELGERNCPKLLIVSAGVGRQQGVNK